MNHFIRPTLLCLTLLVQALGLAAQTQTPDLSAVVEQLNSLKAEVGAIRAENAALRQQLGYDAKGKPAAAIVVAQGKETRLALGGFLHFQAETGNAADSRFPANDRFLLRKIRLGAKGSFGDKFDFSLTADLGNNSLNSTSSYRAQGTDIFVVWKAHPAASFTLGQFKTPYGHEFLVGDVKTVSVERSLASDQLTLGRQAGAMVNGAFFEKKLTYAAAITNGNGANNSFNDNEQFTAVGRVAGALFENKQVRVSAGTGLFSGRDTGTFTGRRTGTGVDLQVAGADAEVSAELLNTRFDRDTGTDYDARGWSVQGTCFLVPNRWQAVARYESYDPSSIAGADGTILRTLGFNYLIKGDDIKLLVNYLIGSPPGSAKHQDRLIARLQVVF